MLRLVIAVTTHIPYDRPARGRSRIYASTDRAMSNNSDIVFPAAARRAQTERGSAHAYEKRITAGFPDRVTPELAAFIAELDTAFLARSPGSTC